MVDDRGAVSEQVPVVDAVDGEDAVRQISSMEPLGAANQDSALPGAAERLECQRRGRGGSASGMLPKSMHTGPGPAARNSSSDGDGGGSDAVEVPESGHVRRAAGGIVAAEERLTERVELEDAPRRSSRRAARAGAAAEARPHGWRGRATVRRAGQAKARAGPANGPFATAGGGHRRTRTSLT